MKVYVDELPKECCECYCCNHDVDYGALCSLGAFGYEDDFCTCNRHKDCPLPTIADHDKEVRKQVCDEIRKSIAQKDSKLEKSTYSDSFVSGYHCCYCDVEQVLDQIEKGENK